MQRVALSNLRIRQTVSLEKDFSLLKKYRNSSFEGVFATPLEEPALKAALVGSVSSLLITGRLLVT